MGSHGDNETPQQPSKSAERLLCGSAKKRFCSPLAKTRTWDLPSRTPASPFRRLSNPLILSAANLPTDTSQSLGHSLGQSPGKHADELLTWIDSMKRKAKTILETQREDEKKFYDELELEKRMHESNEDVRTEALEKLKEFLDSDTKVSPSSYAELEVDHDGESSAKSTASESDIELIEEKVDHLNPYAQGIESHEIEYDSEGNVLSDGRLSSENASDGASEYTLRDNPDQYNAVSRLSSVHSSLSSMYPDLSNQYTQQVDQHSEEEEEEEEEEENRISEDEQQGSIDLLLESEDEEDNEEDDVDIVPESEQENDFSANEVSSARDQYEQDQEQYETYPTADAHSEDLYEGFSGLDSMAAAALSQLTRDQPMVELMNENVSYDDEAEDHDLDEIDEELFAVGESQEEEVIIDPLIEEVDRDVAMHHVVEKDEGSSPEIIEGQSPASPQFLAYEEQQYFDSDDEPFQDPSASMFGDITQHDLDISEEEGQVVSKPVTTTILETSDPEAMPLEEPAQTATDNEVYDGNRPVESKPTPSTPESEVEEEGEISFVSFSLGESNTPKRPPFTFAEASDMFVRSITPELSVPETKIASLPAVQEPETIDEESTTPSPPTVEDIGEHFEEPASDGSIGSTSHDSVDLQGENTPLSHEPEENLEATKESTPPSAENSSKTGSSGQIPQKGGFFGALNSFVGGMFGPPDSSMIEANDEIESAVVSAVTKTSNEMFEESLGETGEKLLDQVEELIEETVEPALSHVVEAAEQFTEATVGEPAPEVTEAISSEVTTIRQEAGHAFTVVDPIMRVAEGFTESLVGESVQEVTDAAEVIEAQITASLKMAEDITQSMISESAPDVTQAAEVIEAKITEALDETADDMFETALGESGLQLVDKVEELIEEVVDDIRDSANEAFDKCMGIEPEDADEMSNDTIDDSDLLAESTVNEVKTPKKSSFADALSIFVKPTVDPFSETTVESSPEPTIPSSPIPAKAELSISSSVTSTPRLPKLELHVPVQPSSLRYSVTAGQDSEADSSIGNSTVGESTAALGEFTEVVGESTGIAAESTEVTNDDETHDISMDATDLEDTVEPIVDDVEVGDQTIDEFSEAVREEIIEPVEELRQVEDSVGDVKPMTIPLLDESTPLVSPNLEPETEEPETEESALEVPARSTSVFKKALSYFKSFTSPTKRSREVLVEEDVEEEKDASAHPASQFRSATPEEDEADRSKRVKLSETTPDFKNRIVMKTRSGRIIGANTDEEIAIAKEVELEERRLIEGIAHGSVKAPADLRDLAGWEDYLENHGSSDSHHVDPMLDKSNSMDLGDDALKSGDESELSDLHTRVISPQASDDAVERHEETTSEGIDVLGETEATGETPHSDNNTSDAEQSTDDEVKEAVTTRGRRTRNSAKREANENGEASESVEEKAEKKISRRRSEKKSNSTRTSTGAKTRSKSTDVKDGHVSKPSAPGTRRSTRNKAK